MKQYFNVTFKWSETVFCSNIAYAESEQDVKEAYSKYEWYTIRPASHYEVEEARRRGKPVIEC